MNSFIQFLPMEIRASMGTESAHTLILNRMLNKTNHLL